jgi:TPP-dependent pyruvate/acetoin dehydrogenase alpha subunit
MTPTDDLTHLYQRMLRIRRVEEKLRDLFAAGKLPGFLHLSIGQEAVAVGICDLLGPDDTLASNHRGHGHSLAKGMDLSGFFAELHGLPAGLCLGRGGSMHVADDRIGMIGANGIVGAGLSLAVGSALAHQVLGREAVAVVFFGDGARAEGLLHESLNLARLWRLPVLFVCENNGWSEFTPGHIGFSGSTPKLAEAFAISYSQADGNDVLAVRESARGALQAIRAGQGPWLLECITHRIRGHYEGDGQKYRPGEQLVAARALDPIDRVAGRLREAGVAQAQLDAIDQSVAAEIDAALVAAQG